ncbi:hypothetical protein INQ51_19010 [Maribellus sp. CM-23]|uniref:hypothetical protein n=1 Tax=Maribellus sp. CM-23 TaxID=2781026 RepID=UPI001F463688|nr:hypothetical protein [Maribellus sp. CM-23]MCE4566418.1 hypothetical protein [Maribellus sp. CM-23]
MKKILHINENQKIGENMSKKVIMVPVKEDVNELNRKIKETAKKIESSVATDLTPDNITDLISAFNIKKYIAKLADNLKFDNNDINIEELIEFLKLPETVVLKNVTDDRIKDAIDNIKDNESAIGWFVQSGDLKSINPKSNDRLDAFLADEVLSHILGKRSEGLFGENEIKNFDSSHQVSLGVAQLPFRDRYRRAYIIDGDRGTKYGPVRLDSESSALLKDIEILKAHAQESFAVPTTGITRPGHEQWLGVDYPTSPSYKKHVEIEREKNEKVEREEAEKEKREREKQEEKEQEKERIKEEESRTGSYIPGSAADPEQVRARILANNLFKKVIWERNKGKTLEDLEQERIHLMLMAILSEAAEGKNEDPTGCGTVPIKFPRSPSLIFPNLPIGPLPQNFLNPENLPLNLIGIDQSK